MFMSTHNPTIRSALAEEIFNTKYRHESAYTWRELAQTLVEDVCGTYRHGESALMPKSDRDALARYIYEMKFIPGGRYLYYAGRPNRFWNNCYMMKAEEDTREDWANLTWKLESALLTGGGIGCDYSVYRSRGSILHGTGGHASGPIPKISMINEVGRRVMQGGSRRSALYASLHWKHNDIPEFLTAKNWDAMPVGNTGFTYADVKRQDFDFPAPLDMTNISVNYDTEWLLGYWNSGDVGDTFTRNVYQALTTGEPGFSFNFFDKEGETLRNACCELSSADDSDVCNIGSLNLARIESLAELRDIIQLAVRFLLCGTIRGQIPYPRSAEVRDRNRRLGLGLMGIHEWLLQRGERYRVTPELESWLHVYQGESDRVATEAAAAYSVPRPKGVRAIAPTGTISMLASTTSGIEPMFAVAFKRRFLKGTQWHYQYVIDAGAQRLIETLGVDPDGVETALDLALDAERRIAFQATLQGYVDHCIASTINLPAWGSEANNPDTLSAFTAVVARYASKLRGLTFYPDGARGGQPLTKVAYTEALDGLGTTFVENNACQSGVCGA